MSNVMMSSRVTSSGASERERRQAIARPLALIGQTLGQIASHVPEHVESGEDTVGSDEIVDDGGRGAHGENAFTICDAATLTPLRKVRAPARDRGTIHGSTVLRCRLAIYPLGTVLVAVLGPLLADEALLVQTFVISAPQVPS